MERWQAGSAGSTASRTGSAPSTHPASRGAGTGTINTGARSRRTDKDPPRLGFNQEAPACEDGDLRKFRVLEVVVRDPEPAVFRVQPASGARDVHAGVGDYTLLSHGVRLPLGRRGTLFKLLLRARRRHLDVDVPHSRGLVGKRRFTSTATAPPAAPLVETIISDHSTLPRPLLPDPHHRAGGRHVREGGPDAQDHGSEGLAHDAGAGRYGHGVGDGVVARVDKGDEVCVCDVGEEGV